jgi:hypothetical protein
VVIECAHNDLKCLRKAFEKSVDKTRYQTPSKNTKLRTAHLHDI